MAERWGFGRGHKNYRTGEWEGIEQKPFDHVFVGDRRVPLLWGEHPHSTSDNKVYAALHPARPRPDWVRWPSSTGQGGAADQQLPQGVRRSGRAEIYVDDVPVDEFSFRDPEEGLIIAMRRVQGLFGSGVKGGLWDDEELARLCGRKVYVDGTPGVITRLIRDQGCVWVEPAVEGGFPPVPWAIEEAAEANRDLGEHWRDTGYHDGQKIELGSRTLWMHRDVPAPLDGKLIEKAGKEIPSPGSGVRRHADRMLRGLKSLLKRHGLRATVGGVEIKEDTWLEIDPEQ